MRAANLAPVPQKPAKAAVAICLALILGWHWPMLQSVAWVGMAVRFSSEMPLTEALAKTFDGRHPCQLCVLVQKGKETEKDQQAIPVAAKGDLFFNVEALRVSPAQRRGEELLTAEARLWRARAEAPPLPPPRVA